MKMGQQQGTLHPSNMYRGISGGGRDRERERDVGGRGKQISMGLRISQPQNLSQPQNNISAANMSPYPAPATPTYATTPTTPIMTTPAGKKLSEEEVRRERGKGCEETKCRQQCTKKTQLTLTRTHGPRTPRLLATRFSPLPPPPPTAEFEDNLLLPWC